MFFINKNNNLKLSALEETTKTQVEVVSYDLVKEKVYDGTTVASISNIIYSIDNVDIKATANYDVSSIDAKSITISFSMETENTNYLVPKDITVNEGVKINKKPVEINVKNAAKSLNEPDPLKYFYECKEKEGKDNSLVKGEQLNFSYTRQEGEAEGMYQINATLIEDEVSKNYDVTIIPGRFTITSSSIVSGGELTSNDLSENNNDTSNGCKGSIYSPIFYLLLVTSFIALKKKYN